MQAAAVVFLLNVISGFVALATSYYAIRFNRVAGSAILTAIGFGFMLLGVGLLAEAGTSFILGRTIIDVISSRVLAATESIVYLSLQVLAYLSFAAGYAKVAYGGTREAAPPAAAALALAPGVGGSILLHSFALASYFVVLVMLAFIVFEGVLVHSRAKSRFSVLVLSAFALIMVAHLILFFSVLSLSAGLFIAGTGVQTLGFVSLLIFLVRSGRVGPA
jgi:hypothetical protein